MYQHLYVRFLEFLNRIIAELKTHSIDKDSYGLQRLLRYDIVYLKFE